MDQHDDLWQQLGFVVAALFAGAIDMSDVRHWADRAIEITDQPATWLIDVAFFDGSSKDIYRILPHVPDRGFSQGHYAALAGIASLRGRRADVAVTGNEALHCLGHTAEGRAVTVEWERVFPDVSLAIGG